MPLVSPMTVASVAPVVVTVCPPGDAVTVYPAMGSPLPPAGLQTRSAFWFPPETETHEGADGTSATVKLPVLRLRLWVVGPLAPEGDFDTVPSAM